MGKNKTAQRTKNNARPSSSGRSAELLGDSMPNFVGFSAAKDGGYIPLLPGLSISKINEIDISKLDTSFQLLLKKMNKKDGTTKLKALQEFTELCQTSTPETIEAILPFWPRIYSQLAIDIEHRVREATHVAHLALVKPTGRKIAPYLKQLAGPWFISQYDTYAPAASAASNAFQNTFPPNKFTDAIVHCQEEILSYVCDNITVQTSQTLGNQKTVTPEEMEARYERLLISSLQGYSVFLKTIPGDQVEKMMHIHDKILSSSKFWKLAKHAVPLIRAAFFSVLASTIQYNQVLFKNEKKKLMTTIMNNLDETEPAVLPVVWEAVLLATCKIEEWHSLVNIEKLILPKLWHVLRHGGYGSANVIYPNLLPFISHLTALSLNKDTLYANFFTNLRTGCKVKSVQLSNSEMLAVVTSFVECLRYVILLNHDNEELCENLLHQQLMTTIEWCATDTSPMKLLFYNQISQLIRYWSKNRNNPEYKCYSMLVGQFWISLREKVLDLLISSKDIYDQAYHANLHESLLDLFLSLKNLSVQSRKHLRVKFVDDNKRAKSDEKGRLKVADDDTVYYLELAGLINNVASAYFTAIQTDSFGLIFPTFYKLLENFESKDLFSFLAKSYESNATLFKFYEETIEKWLTEKRDDIRVVMKLLFLVLKYLENSEKLTVFDVITKMNDKNVSMHAIECGLAKQNRNDQVVREWFLRDDVSSLLLQIATEIVNEEDAIDSEMNRRILMSCFECSESGGLIISQSLFDNIVGILCSALKKDQQDEHIIVIEFLCDLSAITWKHEEPGNGVVKIIESLFELSCRSNLDPSTIRSSSTVERTWTEGLKAVRKNLAPSKLVDLTKSGAKIVSDGIFQSKHAQFRENLTDMAANFIKVLIEDDCDNEYTTDIVTAFIAQPNMETWISHATTSVLYAEVVSGHLSRNVIAFDTRIGDQFVKIDLENEFPGDYVANCVKWALFNVDLLKKLFLNKKASEENLEEDDETSEEIELAKKHCILIIEKTFTNVLYIYAVGHSYLKYYSSAECYSTVKLLLNDLKTVFQCTYPLLEDNISESILNFVTENCRTQIGIWPHVLRFYSTELAPLADSSTYVKNLIATSTTANQSSIVLQAVQVFFDHLQLKDIPSNLLSDSEMLVVARSLVNNGREDELSFFISTLDKVIQRYRENVCSFLFDVDVSTYTWTDFIESLEIITFLTNCVTIIPTKLTSQHWDFVLISIASWQLSVRKSLKHSDSLKVTAFVIAVNRAFRALQELLNEHEKNPIEQLPETILDEWKNVFCDDVHAVVVETWMYCANLYNDRKVSPNRVIPLNYLGESLTLVDDSIFFKQLNTASSIPTINSERAMKLSFKLLQSSIPSLQLSAYQALKKIIPELVGRDKALIELEKFDPNALNLKRLENVLANTQNIVNAILLDFKLCETISCTIQPYTDSYTYTLGYLFVWAILLDMCSLAHAELRYQYAELLKNDYFPCLLNNLFRLMPVEVLQDNKNKAVKLHEIFSTTPSFSFSESWTEWRLDHLVCWLYANSLRQLPVLVRQWWGSTDSRVGATVERITTMYVSPMLCQEELNSNKLTDIENMQVKIHTTAREVIATYQVEDAKLELTIVLPVNHPLGPVTVEPGQHAGGAANWRNCHMQLSIFLTHQNGSIWDGLTLWKHNLDKRFSGVEECYICFSIVHATSYQIPKLSCHTCRKKFHTPCLYKWFSTSQKSTCPICRNIF